MHEQFIKRGWFHKNAEICLNDVEWLLISSASDGLRPVPATFASRPGSCMLWLPGQPNQQLGWVAPLRRHIIPSILNAFFLVGSIMFSLRSQCSPTPRPMANGDGVCLGIEGIRRDMFVKPEAPESKVLILTRRISDLIKLSRVMFDEPFQYCIF